MLPKRTPEHQRRAVRLALGVGIPCLLGFALFGPEHFTFSHDIQTLCKWAAISAAVVGQQPLLGKSSQVGAERLVGTFLGGTSGFLVHSLGSNFLFGEASDGLWLAISATCLAFTSVLVGYKLKLEGAARLYIIAFLIVTFAGDAGIPTWRIAAVRTFGIALGVVTMLALAAVVMPKSASMQCLHHIDDAIQALHHLHALVWRRQHRSATVPLLHQTCPVPIAINSTTGLASLVTSPRPSAPLLGAEEEGRNAIETAEEQQDDALTEVYSSLFALKGDLPAARNERLAWSFNGRFLLAPAPSLFFRGDTPDHLPWEALETAQDCLRRAARATQILGQALEAGDADVVRAIASGSDAILKNIAAAGDEVLSVLHSAFPDADKARRQGAPAVLKLLDAVEKWEESVGSRALIGYRSSRQLGALALPWQRVKASLARHVFVTEINSQRPVVGQPTRVPRDGLGDNTENGVIVDGVQQTAPIEEGIENLSDKSANGITEGLAEWWTFSLALRRWALDLADLTLCIGSTEWTPHDPEDDV